MDDTPCTHPEPLDTLTLACGDKVRHCPLCHTAWIPGTIHKKTITLDFKFDAPDDGETTEETT